MGSIIEHMVAYIRISSSRLKVYTRNSQQPTATGHIALSPQLRPHPMKTKCLADISDLVRAYEKPTK